MPPSDDDQVPISRFRAPDGSLVAEADLTQGRQRRIEELIERARALGAERLWVHAHVLDAGYGFTRRGSYVRLEAAWPPKPLELPFPPLDRVREIQRACFGDLWGHQDPPPPAADSLFVGLHERGNWIGICEVDSDAQWIDGPGIVPSLRSPDRYIRLIRGAAAYLRNEPVVLESWGDAPTTLAAYQSLGFAVVRSVSGWELDLRDG